jgi:hypothetical protein
VVRGVGGRAASDDEGGAKRPSLEFDRSSP